MAVCQLPPASPLPDWIHTSSFVAITRTAEELSVVCQQQVVPNDVKKVDNWRMFKVEGPLDFSQVGVISSLATPLAESKIPIFVISTYNTDYLLVESLHVAQAKSVLQSFCTLRE